MIRTGENSHMSRMTALLLSAVASLLLLFLVHFVFLVDVCNLIAVSIRGFRLIPFYNSEPLLFAMISEQMTRDMMRSGGVCVIIILIMTIIYIDDIDVYYIKVPISISMDYGSCA